MVKQLFVVGFAACLSSSAWAQATDSCGSAPLVGVGIFTYDLTGATNDYPGTCGATATAEDAWLVFSSPVAGTVTATTCGLRGGDTVLELVSACGGVTIACNDDSCGVQSVVSGAIGNGQSVWIRVAKYDGGGGSGSISVTFTAFTATDDCASAPAVSAGGTYPFNVANASNDFAGSCGVTASAGDVWYQFTAPRGGLFTAETCGQTGDDTVLELVSACGGVTIACNDDACAFQSRTSTVMSGGQNIKIRVAGYAGDLVAGNIAIAFTPDVGGPPNDDCAAATVVGVGTYPYDLVGSTNDFTGTCGATAIAEDVWFLFTAPTAGTMMVSTCGLAINDTVLALVDGCGGLALTCVDDTCGVQTTVSTEVTAGQAVLIRLAQYGGGQHVGQFVLTLTGASCTADFNGDGVLDPDDLADYIGAFFVVPPGAGSDFNNDGITDPDDLADFIGAFFTGCP